jgi:hypothetical protein
MDNPLTFQVLIVSLLILGTLATSFGYFVSGWKLSRKVPQQNGKVTGEQIVFIAI